MKRSFRGLCDWLSNKRQRVGGEAGEPSQAVVPFDPLSENNLERAAENARALEQLRGFYHNDNEIIGMAVDLENSVKDSFPVLNKKAQLYLLAARRNSNHGVVPKEQLQAIAGLVSAEFEKTLLAGLERNNDAHAKNAHNLQRHNEAHVNNAHDGQISLPRFVNERTSIYSLRCQVVTFLKNVLHDIDWSVWFAGIGLFVALSFLWFPASSRDEKGMVGWRWIRAYILMYFAVFSFRCYSKAVWLTVNNNDSVLENQWLRDIESKVELNKRNKRQIRN
jgi:hypothetical protein